MNKIFLFLTVVVLTGCSKYNKDKSKEKFDISAAMKVEEAEKNIYDFKKIPSFIEFKDSSVTGIKDERQSILIQEGFLSKGLPYGINFIYWKHSVSKNYAFLKYKSFVSKNSRHKYIDVFRQYGSHSLLVGLNLLADSTEEGIERIFFLTKELIESKSYNITLLAYCFEKLKGKVDNKIVEEMTSQALVNFENGKKKGNFQRMTAYVLSRKGKLSETDARLVEVYNTLNESAASLSKY